MPKIDTYRKQAKQLVRWHRGGNYSVGEKVRLLGRFRDLSDVQVLAMPLPLTLAQEIVATEAGFADWLALKAAVAGGAESKSAEPAVSAPLKLTGLVPILFVRDVMASAGFYRDRLGFDVDFLYGKPPFYGAVSRDGICLHLRLVASPNFADLARQECSLILASIEVTDVKALFDELQARGAEFPQTLERKAWGGLDFQVRDPNGNVISFVQYSTPSKRPCDTAETT